MKNINEVRKSLKFILDKGDLFDVISLKENVKSRSKVFLKTNILIFSRILYGGVLIFERIKAHFAPIQKVKKAQDNIRASLGVNVDIVRSKRNYNNLKTLVKSYFNAHLAVLYSNLTLNMDAYIEQLRKIFQFCELFDIEEILLNQDDIYNKFCGVDISNFKSTNANLIIGTNFENDLNSDLLVLTRADLLELINMLEVVNIDKEFIVDLSDRIEDQTLKNAIEEFNNTGDIERLKKIVVGRLNLNINSDSSYRDKENGKVFENIIVEGEYVRVITSNSQGEQISNVTMTLCDYLEVKDYLSLISLSAKEDDRKNTFLISALHLYLAKYKRINSSIQESVSLYDRIYRDYKNKKLDKSKKILGLNSKRWVFSENILLTYISFGLALLLYISSPLVGLPFDFIQYNIFKSDDESLYKRFTDAIRSAYTYSLNVEKEILGGAIDKITGFFEKSHESVGDVNNNGKEETIATVVPLQNYVPRYFAESYATSASYGFGTFKYDVEEPPILYEDFRDLDPLFSIEIEMSKRELKKAIKDEHLNIEQGLYPLGGNFILTMIYITDKADFSKLFVIDANRAQSTGNFISDIEQDLLTSMESPVIHYVYGISYSIQNNFVSQIRKDDSYTSLLPDEVKEAVIEGLGLKEDASLEEIFYAIKNKEYSKTPIKDAGLTWKVKFSDEKEYLETISSLDSTVCNLAATLAVAIDDDLIYTSGYYNESGKIISSEEAHAWAITEEGQIVDLTPHGEIQEEEEESYSAIKNILAWGLEHHIPAYAISILIVLVFEKMFGKKIRLQWKINRLEHLLTQPKVEEAYAQLKDNIYGEKNIPVERSVVDFLDTINSELSGFSVEELRAIKRELLRIKPKIDRESLKFERKLLDEVPFIRENKEELRLKFSKKDTHNNCH